MLSEALRLIRVFNKKSQEELSKSLGISRSYLCEIETNKKKPTLEILEKYKECFDIPVSTILLFSENLSADSFSEKARSFTANNLLKVMRWISPKDEPSHACNETN